MEDVVICGLLFGQVHIVVETGNFLRVANTSSCDTFVWIFIYYRLEILSVSKVWLIMDVTIKTLYV